MASSLYEESTAALLDEYPPSSAPTRIFGGDRISKQLKKSVQNDTFPASKVKWLLLNLKLRCFRLGCRMPHQASSVSMNRDKTVSPNLRDTQ